jgi:hypothetical protein
MTMRRQVVRLGPGACGFRPARVGPALPRRLRRHTMRARWTALQPRGDCRLSLYRGTFSVQNKTGFTIHDVIVTHVVRTRNENYDAAVRAASLADGASTAPQWFQSLDGENDYWSVYFTIDYGPKDKGKIQYYREAKQCNYESSDSPQNCSVVLMVDKFSVNIPVTSSCLDNYLEHRSVR